jgi:hypothetical protein
VFQWDLSLQQMVEWYIMDILWGYHGIGWDDCDNWLLMEIHPTKHCVFIGFNPWTLVIKHAQPENPWKSRSTILPIQCQFVIEIVPSKPLFADDVPNSNLRFWGLPSHLWPAVPSTCSTSHFCVHKGHSLTSSSGTQGAGCAMQLADLFRRQFLCELFLFVLFVSI